MTSEWHHEAACRGHDPELFFPIGIVSKAARTQATLAKLVCAGCPVRAACQEFALSEPTIEGVWGGLHLPYDHPRYGNGRWNAPQESKPRRMWTDDERDVVAQDGISLKEVAQVLGRSYYSVLRMRERVRNARKKGLSYP